MMQRVLPRGVLTLRHSKLSTSITGTNLPVLSPLEQKYFPHLGNREIVGFGRNGTPMYLDDIWYPYPGIRFRNHTAEIDALRKKEQGPWSNLSLDEVKTLYRHSFCQTIEEATAPSGQWKLGFAWGFMLIGTGALISAYLRYFICDAPKSVMELPEYKEALKYKKVFSRSGDYHIMNEFDVKNMRWRE